MEYRYLTPEARDIQKCKASIWVAIQRLYRGWRVILKFFYHFFLSGYYSNLSLGIIIEGCSFLLKHPVKVNNIYWTLLVPYRLGLVLITSNSNIWAVCFPRGVMEQGRYTSTFCMRSSFMRVKFRRRLKCAVMQIWTNWIMKIINKIIR